ncbi:MAG: alpha-N-arabinofuranosidase, partial [Ruminococcus sp.]|nr:alpha-N-arabinofuranosidase [Ruminococcus sp.]
ITTRGYGGGTFAVKTAWDGEELGEIEIENSNVWKKYTSDIRIPDGVNAIWFTFKGTGNPTLGSFTLE